ncbi:MAG TPA: ABC transporter ATP-binding protein [Woeseiaceae bacterium]|nr:ABC transporter ATP-binding protein [Woeseiaceae bacterium]
MSSPGTSEAAHLLLRFDELSVAFGSDPDGLVVDRVSLSIHAGEVLAVVGESGSGKTMLSRAVLDLLPPGGRICHGRILFDGVDLRLAPAERMRRIRGRRIGMVFQEPMTSLNPALKVGFQMVEGLRHHHGLPREECRQRAIEMLQRMDVPNAAAALDRYPHEFSGGLRQRLLIASVFLLEPSLLIADEPTTALDVLVQKQVFDIMLEVARDLGTAVLLITHDLGVVARYADRAAVLHGGRLLESGTVRDVLLRPQHQYTRALMGALPRRELKPQPVPGPPLFEVRDLTVEFAGRRTWPWQRPSGVRAVDRVDLTIRQGETLAVVGESGSGKTTLARALLNLAGPRSGSVLYKGRDVAGLAGDELRQYRSSLQIVFQDPWGSLDPRMRIRSIVAEGLRTVKGVSRREKRRRSEALLAEVGLGAEYLDRYPHELSGGQRQRVNIARALVAEPEFVVADEPVSALDIIVQAEILALLERVQKARRFTCLFISHDLGVVEQIAERVVVMYRGRIVEEGTRDQVFGSPAHPYTRELLAAAPRLVLAGEQGYCLGEFRQWTA